MEEDKNQTGNAQPSNGDDVDNQLDDLLPVPSTESEPVAGQVDGTMDTTLPPPGDESHAGDDATTHEELGVDTTADAIDDGIESSPDRTVDGGQTDPDESAEVLEIAGEPVTWEPVVDQTEKNDDPGPDTDPVNHDSEFFASTYRAGTAPGTSETSARALHPAPEPDASHHCTACGAAIGKSPYCPLCGTDQYPQSRRSALLSPLLSWSRPLVIRAVLTVAVTLVLIALLANSGASALIISAMAIPVVLVVRLAMQLQAHASIGWIQIGMMAFVGLVAGLPLAWFAARTVRQSWIETGVLNFGAAGFGGSFAAGAGAAPFIVWLVAGLLLPVVVILGIGAIPAALRMVVNPAPRESTGMLLSGAVAAGYVVASGIMFYRPLYSELAPRMTTSQWTLTIFGLAVIRPLVWIFSGAMIGAVVWRYLRTSWLASIVVPAAIAVAIPVGFSLLSLGASSGGYWLETIVGLIFALVAVFFYHRFLPVALKHDAGVGSGPGKQGVNEQDTGFRRTPVS